MPIPAAEPSAILELSDADHKQESTDGAGFPVPSNGLPKDHFSTDDHIIDVNTLLLLKREYTKVRTVEADPAAETHYVLVIHGTFSRPKKKGLVNWFHPDDLDTSSDNFCRRLAVRLSDGHFGEDAVWRTLPDPELLPVGVTYPFYWDGSNTDEGRKDGAWHLAKLIRHIANRDPSARIHMIAHSHGGNVALKAIEQYVQKLEPRSAESEWPDAVRERFHEAHQAAAVDIARWRRVERAPWWGAVLPFLVLWRGEKGEAKSDELYPWAYYRGVDKLLDLGRRRKRLYLQNRRMTSPVSNALGKVVFLGTPFYVKHWVDWALLKIFVSFFISLILGFVLTFLAVGIWAGILGFDTSHNVILWMAAGLTVLLFLAELLGFVERTMFRSGNMYHSHKVPWSPAQHALVVQAGKLDEAALALSAEPAARAFLLPLVRRATRRAGFVSFPRRPGAHAGKRARAFYGLAVLRALILNIVLLFPRIIFWLISKLVVRNTFNTIHQIVMGLAYGLDTANLKNARVFVDETLALKGVKRNIRSWDVRKLLAESEARGLSQTWVEEFLREKARGKSGRGAAEETDSLLATPEQGVAGEVEPGVAVKPGTKNPGFIFRGSFKEPSEDYDEELPVGDKGEFGRLGDFVSSSESSYSFLWDDTELLARSDSSPMFNRLKTQLRNMDFNPRLSKAQFARELRVLCCVVESRLAEIRSHWQLTHATYYRNEEIVQAIVDFLNESKCVSD